MEALINKLTAALAGAFPGCQVAVSRSGSGGRVGGSITWAGFDGLDQIDRQHRLRGVLDGALSADERREVSLILTFTPAEQAVMRAG